MQAEDTDKMNTKKSTKAPPQSEAVLETITCEACTGKRLRAVKSCIDCQASFCETHIQPHHHIAAWKDHKLIEPNENLQQTFCVKHNKRLEIFCKTDQVCLCIKCFMDEHRTHDIVELEKERAEKQAYLLRTWTAVKKKTGNSEKILQQITEAVEETKLSANKEVQESENSFAGLIAILAKMCNNVTEQIRQQEKKEVEKAKRAMKQLEKEIENMKRKSADMTELLKTDDYTHFFKTVSSLCVPLDGKASPKIKFSRQFSSEILRMEISYLKEHLMKISEWKMKQLSLSASDTPIYILVSSDQKERLELLQYSCLITLDPNTAHRQLNVSEENKKVTVTEKQANYDDNPDRFDNWWQILSREALTGTRCYWEVEVCGKEAEIGITYKGIGRKGDGKDSKLGGNDLSWSMRCSNCSSSLWHNNKSIISKTAEIHHRRVGVYLDWSAGFLKFYGVTDSAALLHTFQTKYTEPLYPAFRLPYHNCSVTICTLNQTGK